MSTTRGADHLPALDGLRGIAILAVMFVHFERPPTGGKIFMPPDHTLAQAIVSASKVGWMGVDLFFVLSGFLITGILLRAKGSPSYFKTFYMRRVLRILPLYYATLAIIFLVVPLFVTITDPETLEFYRHQGWLWAHSINIFFALRGHFLEGGWLSIGHFWSLSVEEHFYLVWPLVVFALRPAALLRFSVACILASPLLRIAIVAAGGSIDTVYALTPCRIDGLATGAALACLYADPRWDTWRKRAPAALCLFGALCTAILVKEHASAGGKWMSSVGYTVIGLASASVLALAVGPAEGYVSRFMRMGVLRWFGKYSYGAYVLHEPLEPFIRQWMPTERIAAAAGSVLVGVIAHAVLGIGLSMLAALGSWHLLEKHFLKLKRYFEYTRSTESAPASAVETA